MFGYLRFFLAFLVVLSHLDIRFYGLNPGVSAVVVFYLLAGYVLSHLFYEIIPDHKYKILLFYKERILRIFPLYLYVLFIVTLFVLISGFGDPHFTWSNTLANLTIIPLNYYMYFDFAVLSDPHWWLIPPAWSLGTELQAYLLLPILFFLKSKYRYSIVIASFIIYTFANFSLLQADYFGYRLLVGVLFIFYMGAAYQKKEYSFLFLLWLSTLSIALIDITMATFNAAYAKETLIGILFGLPLLITLAKSKIRLPFNAKLGALSYGLFLAHFPTIWMLEYTKTSFSSKYLEVFVIVMIALCIAYIGIVSVEKYVKRYRIFKK